MTDAELQKRAKELRRNPAEWEIRLWRHLSRSQTGFKFRRQHVIAPFICDLFCPAKGVVVEINGDTHRPEIVAHRDLATAHHGYVTLHFTNTDGRDSIEGVVERIVATCHRRPDRWPACPTPTPPLKGRDSA